MARCDHCGNDYDKAFQVVRNGSSKTFDSFECAIQMMAPATAWRRPDGCSAARTAPSTRVLPRCATALESVSTTEARSTRRCLLNVRA